MDPRMRADIPDQREAAQGRSRDLIQGRQDSGAKIDPGSGQGEDPKAPTR